MKSMEPESKTKFRIEQVHRDEARRVAVHKAEDRKARGIGKPGDVKNFYTGALGEMLAAAYLGVDWKDPGYAEYDLTDEYGTKYQVKTTHDRVNRHHHPCEKESKWPDKCDFERYIFVTLAPDDGSGTVDANMEKEMTHLNVHATKFGPPGLWRRPSQRQSNWRQVGDKISCAAS